MNQPSSSARQDPGPAPDKAPARAAGQPGPGVPLSVWAGFPVPAGSQDGPPCGRSVTRAAAAQVIDSFTRHGDLVAIVGELPAVAEAAAAAGRSVLSIVPGDLGGYPDVVPGAGQAALAITGYCGPGCCASARYGDDSGGLLYAACERLLRPGGVLAVLIADPGTDEHSSLAGSAVAAARAASLSYAQHITLVHAFIDDDRLNPGPAPAAVAGGIRIHSDLLVFTKPGGNRP